MSNPRPTENVNGEKPVYSLTKALEEVSQKGNAQIVALQEREKQLGSLQIILLDTENRGEVAARELRAVGRQVVALEDELDQQQRGSQALFSRRTSAHRRNLELQLGVDEEQEEARVTLALYDTYRSKMEGHRAQSYGGLGETGGPVVRTAEHRREEMGEDLEDPDGEAVLRAQGENERLRGQIASLRSSVAAERERLLKESGAHDRMKKDIQIQNRRHEAIVKRLRCQLNKAQAIHRQISGDIVHMERQISELRRRLIRS